MIVKKVLLARLIILMKIWEIKDKKMPKVTQEILF
jgi:hypothetical protein